MTNKINKVFILGSNGFPYGSARIEKLKLISKSLVKVDINVTFICNEWVNNSIAIDTSKGYFEGINYIYTTGIVFQPKDRFHRLWYRFIGKLREIYFLLKNKCDVSIICVDSGIFLPIFKYWLISKISGFKIYYLYHEDEDVLQKDKDLNNKINLFLFKKYIWKIIDGVLPINKYLQDRIKTENPTLPQLTIPALVDYELFNIKRKLNQQKYFFYCGSLAYFEIIEFIIKSFERINESEYKLYILSFGDKNKELELDKIIENSSKSKLIERFGYLDYESLIDIYINASALLIPLRDTLQDIARFPHKIGEYTASKNPIITTNVGVIPFYFENYKSALIAEKYEIIMFAKLMQFVVDNPEKSIEIGHNGFQIGKDNFDYSLYGEKLIQFWSNNRIE